MNTLDQTTLSLEVARHFDAPPDRVFDAWLSPGFAAWIGPKDLSCELLRMDAVVGGSYLLRMTHAGGNQYDFFGEYHVIARPSRLVFTWKGTLNNMDTVVTVLFAPDGDGTIMTLQQEGFSNTGMRDGFYSGWSAPGNCFDKLAAWLTR
jgi:uncharacterized protein YndB with AHSA1/START domain